MSDFKDFNELFDPLVLPIGGKEYRIPPVSAPAGMKFNAAINGETKMPDIEFLPGFLGDAYQEMLDDGVSYTAIRRAAMTALADFQTNRSAALIMWETGGDPKAMTEHLQSNAPNRAARRSKPTAAANTTKRPGSTSGTKKAPRK